jgi:hypothetical protein
LDALRWRLDAATRHAVRAEASARRCQQDLTAERYQHERDLATAAERVRVAEGSAAELRAALDMEGARAKAAEAARAGAQAEAAAARQQQHEHDLATAIERAKMADARAAELRNALEVERQRAEAAEAARDAAQAEARSLRDGGQRVSECGRLSAALPAEGEEPALVGVPNVGLTCHLGACVIALRHVHGFCGLVEDSSPAR